MNLYCLIFLAFTTISLQGTWDYYFTEPITTPSIVTAFRLYEYNKKRNGLKPFTGKYRLLEVNIAKYFLQGAKRDPNGIVYIEDPHKAGVLVREAKAITYRQYLEKIKKYHQKLSVTKLLHTLACLQKSTSISILINYIIPTDIIGLEDFIVTRQDALAIIEFLGCSTAEAENFLDATLAHKPEICVNHELELYNVHILKIILEQILTN